MPHVSTRFFGDCEYDPADIFSFPSGIPGFEDQHSFLFLKIQDSEPLLFLQSVAEHNLCFILLPVATINPDYRLTLSEDELCELQLPLDRQPKIGVDILCAGLVRSAAGRAPTANLMAPVVVNLKKKIGMQIIRSDSGYSCRHAISFEQPVLAC